MKAILTAITLLTLLACAQTTLAYSCLGNTSVCSSFANAQAVFVGAVTHVENQTVKLADGREASVGQIANVQVEESFKGTKATELIFRSHGTSEEPNYKEGQRWLFYALYSKQDKAWAVVDCDRTRLIEYAAADLLYLRGLPASAQTTRLAGLVKNGADKPLAGVKVKLTGKRQSYEVLTDKNGVYEVYDLPAGIYVIEPEFPATLKPYMQIASSDVVHWDQKGNKGVELKEKSCAGIDFYYHEDTSIAGRVFGADGLPLPRVCVHLISKDRPREFIWFLSCTDDEGRFKIKEFDLGDYFLVANEGNRITSDEPFPLVYYPGVFEKEKATVLTFTTGDKLVGYDIHIPSQRPTRIIAGRLLFSDGRPVMGASVLFEPDAGNSNEEAGRNNTEAVARNNNEAARTSRQTDADGRFRMSVLSGSKGTLYGYLQASEGDYENCPKLDNLIRQDKEIETNRLKLDTVQDHFDVELVFAFPYCAKAKKP